MGQKAGGAVEWTSNKWTKAAGEEGSSRGETDSDCGGYCGLPRFSHNYRRISTSPEAL